MNRFERPDEDVICPLCNEYATRADGEWGECGICVNCGEFCCTHKPNVDCDVYIPPTIGERTVAWQGWSSAHAAQKRLDVLEAMEES